MTVPGDRPGASARRAIPLFAVAYAVALVTLGLADAVALAARVGAGHRLTLVELSLLSAFSLRSSPTVHLALLAAGAAFVTAMSFVPMRRPRTRVVLLCAPLALAAVVTARAAEHLPGVARALGSTGVWVAVLLAPPACVALGLALSRLARSRAWVRRLVVIALVLALAAFVRVFGLTEAVTARIPGTLLSLTGLTYLIGYGLRDVRRPGRVALVLGACLGGAGLYAAGLPSARSARVDAIVAHKTQLLQALLFAELALFRQPPELPECSMTATASATPASASPSASARPNVLVITVDALRADHLRAYGYDRTTMPNVEALLRESVLFETAYSAAPATAGSLTALWTGSSAYTMRALGRWPPTLQQRMRELGYRVLGTDLSRIASATAPGFPKTPLWDEPIRADAGAARIVDGLIERIAQAEGPFLAFAHFFETHDATAYRHVPEVFPARARSRYDDAMFEVDRQLGRLLSALRAGGRYDDALVVFSADHGEFFGEHGRMHHGSLLYEPALRVPFAIKLPGVRARRERAFVSGFDLAPTVYRAATGRPWPLFTLGRDVLGDVDAGMRDRTIYAENVSGERGVRRVVAVRKGRFKYTRLRGTDVEELFDLERDPGELDNLAGEAPGPMQIMRGELQGMLEAQACELRALADARVAGPAMPAHPPSR